MITGDAEPVARTVAAQLGIDRVFAGVRPEDKAAKVQELQAEGLSVAMVGDGVNDAPALAQADVGIAIGAGTDVAIASAGVILASSDPRSVLSVIELSRASYRKMSQNLWWAGRVQPHLGAARRGRARADRVRAADVGRRDPDVALDDHRRRERAAAAPARPAARGVDPRGARAQSLIGPMLLWAQAAQAGSVQGMDDSIAVLVAGAERRLLEPEVRRDPEALGELLHASFREIGKSGRLWTRDELIDVMTGSDAVELQSAVVTGEHVELVAPDLALLTYKLDANGERSRRSSLWRIADGRPRLVFHQGTPLAPGVA